MTVQETINWAFVISAMALVISVANLVVVVRRMTRGRGRN